MLHTKIPTARARAREVIKTAIWSTPCESPQSTPRALALPPAQCWSPWTALRVHAEGGGNPRKKGAGESDRGGDGRGDEGDACRRVWRQEVRATNNIKHNDKVIIQREFISTLPSLELSINAPFIFDVDDAIFLHKKGIAAKMIAKKAEHIICGNNFLANYFDF